MNNKLTQINEKELSKCLQLWFQESKGLIESDFWRRNPVGKVIKNNLKIVGKWRYRARGNPKKGWEASKKKITDW